MAIRSVLAANHAKACVASIVRTGMTEALAGLTRLSVPPPPVVKVRTPRKAKKKAKAKKRGA